MRALLVALAFASFGCDKAKPPAASAPRVAIVAKGPAQIELIPAAGQPPYCLVYTIPESGRPIRHLTLLEDKLSSDCPAGEPIMGSVFKIPPREGKVKIYVIFSDRALDSNSIGQQIDDLQSQETPITAMDLRAPGKVQVEVLSYLPSTGS